MKVMCIGANIESEIVLRELIRNEVKITALITRPPTIQKVISDYVDLHPLCIENDIPVIDTMNVNSAETIEIIREFNPDFLFTLGWSQIFSKQLIGTFNEFIIGSHPTKLPEGRGRAPVPWSIILEKKESAVSFFKIDEGIDSGELILQSSFVIPERAYAWDVYKLVSNELKKGFLNLYIKLKSGSKIEKIQQDYSKISYYAKRTPVDGKIDFNESTKNIDCLIRAVSYPYPGAYSFYKFTKVFFNKCVPEYEIEYHGIPGQILLIRNEKILVKTGDYAIWLSSFEINGKKFKDTKMFIKHDKFGIDIEEELFKMKNLGV